MAEFALIMGILVGWIGNSATTGIEESKKVCYFNETTQEISCWKKSSASKNVDKVETIKNLEN